MELINEKFSSFFDLRINLRYLLKYLGLKTMVRQDIIGCVKKYLAQQHLVYQKITLITIRQGINFRARNAGSYLVKVECDGETISLFAKKNANLKRLYLFSKSFFSLQSSRHCQHHNFILHKLIHQNGISVAKPLYVCDKDGIILTEYVEGVPLNQALKIDYGKTIELFKDFGIQIAKLHLINIVHQSLKPQHILFDLKNNRLVLIDCDTLNITSSTKDYIKDVSYLFLKLNLCLSKHTMLMLQDAFFLGYNKIMKPYHPKLLAKLRRRAIQINKQYVLIKLEFKIFTYIDRLLNNLTLGFVKI